MSNLTNDERAVLEKLADTWAAFRRLPCQRTTDQSEFAGYILSAERMVTSRPVVRDEGWVNRALNEEQGRQYPDLSDYSKHPARYEPIDIEPLMKSLREHVVADWEKDDMRAKGYNVIWGDDAFIPLFPNATDLSPGFKEQSAAWSYMYFDYFLNHVNPTRDIFGRKQFE